MISLRSILRGAVTRFIPAMLVSLALFFGIASLSGPLYVGWWYLAEHLALFSLGYVGTLVAVRRLLRGDADVAGRRGIVAGLMAPLAYFSAIVIVPLATPGQHNLLSGVVGVLLALGLFFPWLQFGSAHTLGVQGDPAALGEGEGFSEMQSFEKAGIRRSPGEPA